MVSVEKIADKLRRLEEFQSILEEMRGILPEDFLKDKILVGSAKYYLQVSIECCLDIANHIIAAERYRAPRDYADSFRVLEEQGILSPELGLKLRQMAKFRNRLVHLYGEIDDAYVHAFLVEDLTDFQAFQSLIAAKYFQ